jgi:DNA-directed RNA polymerase subunit RPC12/RpoP
MSSRNQPTPPFNSPYQHAIRPTAMLQSTAYPSPARSDSEPSKYSNEGLGLYPYPHSYATSGPAQSSVLYPPSPQPTESWHQLTSGTSPLMTEATADPWAANYDHATSRSPLSWAPQHTSHRSSLSSTRDMSIFSREGSELVFPQIKLEGGSEWPSDEESSASTMTHAVSMTVSPERLSTGVFAYDHSYGSPAMSRYEPSVGDSYKQEDFKAMSYEGQSQSSGEREGPGGITARTRLRRNPTTAENANYTCHKCGKLFQRSYNHKTHLETHNPSRKKEHRCPHRDCDKQFVRKTDLDRHEKSVHLKRKDFRCGRCDAHFARKDTLRR